jgi:hypothetical protein
MQNHRKKSEGTVVALKCGGAFKMNELEDFAYKYFMFTNLESW